MKNVVEFWQQVLARRYAERNLIRLVVIALTLVVLFGALSPSTFLTPINAETIALSVPEIALLGLATMLAMLTGGIDLSIVSTANLAALSVAVLFQVTGTQDATGIQAVLATVGFVIVGLAVGAIAGAFNALLVAVVGITPILATLGTMLAYNGLAISLTGGKAFYGMPDAFLALGNDTLGPLPFSFIALLGVAVGLGYLVRRTGLGIRLILVGSGAEAARYSGISIRGVLTRTYVLAGVLAAGAGLVIASRSASAAPDYGASYVLLAIVIAILGGTNPDGGYGTVTGVVLAALILQILSSGMNLAGLSSFQYQIAQGAILILVMVWDAARSTRRRVRGDAPAPAAIVPSPEGEIRP